MYCHCHCHYLKTNSAKRPSKSISPTDRYQLLQDYPVGDEFMKLEESLSFMYEKKGGWPYTNLRVGNVIGAREAEIRQWFAQVWIHGHLHLGMPLHVTSLEKISFTYNYDIAQAIWKVWVLWNSEDEEDRNSVLTEAFNIACEERFTQNEWLYAVAEAVGLNKLETTGATLANPPKNTTNMIKLYPQNKDGIIE